MDKNIIKNIQKLLGVTQDGDIGPITRKAIADKLITIARNEIGVSEIGESNKGVRVEEYQRSTNLDGTGWPWCAAYICWIFQQSELLGEYRPRMASAFAYEKWARGLGINVLNAPQTILRGDIVIWRFSHISMATSDSNNGKFMSIEGNTNNAGGREGGSVLEKSRSINQVRSVIRF